MKKLSKYFRIFLPKSLSSRFVLIILSPLLFLQLTMMLFFYERHWDTISKRLALDITGEINIIAEIINSHNSSQHLTNIFKIAKDNLNLDISFYQNKQLNLNTYKKEFTSQSKKLKLSLKNLKYPYIMQEGENNAQNISVQLPSGVLNINIPKKRFFSSTVLVFLVLTLGSFILFFLIAFLFMKNQIKAIKKLSIAAENFGKGISIPFHPSGALEVKQAGKSFILMKNRIHRYLSERTDLLSGVSHDLKTPLTRMKLQLSLMHKNQEINDLLDDVKEMEDMLSAYLNFTKGLDKNESTSFYLDEVLHECIHKAKRMGQSIQIQQIQKILFFGKKLDISRAITNIISNAHRYATLTSITLKKHRNNTIICVEDNGPGIPKKHADDVFKAFYRIDSSRNLKTGGIGLGLTITRDIILAHGGKIKLEKSKFGGLKVIISFEAISQV